MGKVRVIAAMSGGVDSAVAAGLLAEAGYDVVGVTMKMYSPAKPQHAKSCCGIDDFDDARRSAAILGIPHYVLDFEQTFKRNVIDRFAAEYAEGRTPNPCVSCNAFVKLGTLVRYADSIGAPFVATGHYARLERRSDGVHLYRGSREKDQAYALAQLSPEKLSRLLLPLGGIDKSQTRRHAKRMELPVAGKPESQDICFVEGGNYRDVIQRLRPETARPGAIVTSAGTRAGTHAGIAGYTVGQRQGLPPAGEPRYVTKIDARTNTIVIGPEEELLTTTLRATALTLIRPERFANGSARVLAMLRYRARPEPAFARLNGDVLDLAFAGPVRAPSPGQLAALLDEGGEEVLGGATVCA